MTPPTSVVGNVPQFDTGYNFEERVELLEAWFDANDITDDVKKRAIFLTSVGSKGYHVLRSLLQPHKPTEKTYKDCKSALAEHYEPKPTEIVQRYRFYNCTQNSQTIPQFVANLRERCYPAQVVKRGFINL